VGEVRSLAERLLDGERGALARAITWAENGHPRFPALLAAFWSRVGRAERVGVTGPPGAGKSTLVNELARLVRAQERTVGILAVDPSSPFSGGALLGDRIRMEKLLGDPGVYIRSMASRGSHGGLALAAVDACDAMDAFGIDEILLETVGVGQAEYEVVSGADTVLVVLCPGAGDSIQAMKAGILEVADVLVVNKADAPGSDRLRNDLEEAVHVRATGRRSADAGEGADVWTPPVVACSAGRGEGVEAVAEAVKRHRSFLADGRLEQRRARMRAGQIRRVVGERLDQVLWGPAGCAEEAQALLQQGVTPYDVGVRILAGLLDRFEVKPVLPEPGARPAKGAGGQGESASS
jgi:LAO/AO transport system kinase